MKVCGPKPGQQRCTALMASPSCWQRSRRRRYQARRRFFERHRHSPSTEDFLLSFSRTGRCSSTAIGLGRISGRLQALAFTQHSHAGGIVLVHLTESLDEIAARHGLERSPTERDVVVEVFPQNPHPRRPSPCWIPPARWLTGSRRRTAARTTTATDHLHVIATISVV